MQIVPIWACVQFWQCASRAVPVPPLSAWFLEQTVTAPEWAE